MFHTLIIWPIGDYSAPFAADRNPQDGAMRITAYTKWKGSGSSRACSVSALFSLLLLMGTAPLLSAPPFTRASTPKFRRPSPAEQAAAWLRLSRGGPSLQPAAADGVQEATLQSRHKHSVGSSPHALPLTWTYAAFLRSQRRSLLTNSK